MFPWAMVDLAVALLELTLSTMNKTKGPVIIADNYHTKLEHLQHPWLADEINEAANDMPCDVAKYVNAFGL